MAFLKSKQEMKWAYSTIQLMRCITVESNSNLYVDDKLKKSFKSSIRIEEKVVRSVDVVRHQCWLWVFIPN